MLCCLFKPLGPIISRIFLPKHHLSRKKRRDWDNQFRWNGGRSSSTSFIIILGNTETIPKTFSNPFKVRIIIVELNMNLRRERVTKSVNKCLQNASIDFDQSYTLWIWKMAFFEASISVKTSTLLPCSNLSF